MKDLKNIEDLFKESFNDFEITPPDSVKASVDNAIKKRNSGIIWWLPVLAILLVTIPLVYYFTSTTQIEKGTPKAPSISINSSSNEEVTRTTDPNNSEKKSNVSSIDSNPKNTVEKTDRNNAELPNSTKGTKAKKQLKSGTTPIAKTTPSKTKYSPIKSTKKTAKKSTKGETIAKQKTNKSKQPKDKKTKYGGDPKTKTNDFSTKKLLDDPDLSDKSNGPEKGADAKDALVDGSENSQSPKDSVDNSNTTAQNSTSNDSINKSNTSENQNQKNEPKSTNREKNWYASVFVGPQFDFMRSENKDYSLLETKPSFKYSAELNRNIVSGFGVSTGIGYFKSNDLYTRYSYQVDSVYSGLDSIPILDQNDSIIGYEYIDTYSVDSTQSTNEFNYSISNIVIPIYISKQIKINEDWGLLLNAGAIYRMSKITGGPVSPSGDEPVITKNSLMISGRVHATYKWNSWMFSLGLNAGYYIKPPVQYQGIKAGRNYLLPELGIHFTF